MQRQAQLTTELLAALTDRAGHAIDRDDFNDLVRGVGNMNIGGKGPRVKLPHFSGATDASYESWARELEEGFQHLQWDIHHPSRVSILPTLLSGLAKLRYLKFPENVRANFRLVMQELERQFGLRSKSAVHIYQQLERTQGDSESVRDYTKDILQRMHDNGIADERYMLATYLKGLKPAIRSQVLMTRPMTFHDAQESAETAEQALAVNNISEEMQRALQTISVQLDKQTDATNAALNAISHNQQVRFDDYRSKRDDTKDYRRARFDRQPSRSPSRSGDNSTRPRTHYYSTRYDQRHTSSQNRYARRRSPSPWNDDNRFYNRQTYDRERFNDRRNSSRDRYDNRARSPYRFANDRYERRNRSPSYDRRRYRDASYDRNSYSRQHQGSNRYQRQPTPYREVRFDQQYRRSQSPRSYESVNNVAPQPIAPHPVAPQPNHEYCFDCGTSHIPGQHNPICQICGNRGHKADVCVQRLN